MSKSTDQNIVTEFDHATCRALGAEIEAAVSLFLAKKGIVARCGGGTFDAGSFSAKLVLTLTGAAKTTADRATFNRHCGAFGLKPEHFGVEFVTARGPAKVCGLAISRPAYPIMATVNGKTVFFREAVVPAILAAAK